MGHPMNKREAEQILGLSRAYMHKDVTKAYRARIKTAHPDAGGSTEEATRLNAAKEFMDALFANEKNAVFSVEAAAAREEPTREETASGVWDWDFSYSSNQQEEEPACEARGDEHPYSSEQQEEQYVAWWEVAYGKNDRQSSVIANGTKGINNRPKGPLPWWYKLADFMVRKFPWKTSLVLVFLAYLLWFVPRAFGGCTPMEIIVLYALFGAAVVNAITGCFTNSFRKAIRFHADNVLFRWQAKRGA